MSAYVTSQKRWTLRPGSRKTLMVVHIIASVALVGEVWGLVVLNLAATLTSDPVLAHSAYELMSLLVFAGGIPLSLIALVSGIVLALSSRWGLSRYYWVFGKLLLLIGVILIGMVLFSPEKMAEEARLESADQWKQVTFVSTQLTMLITAAVLSVFKPRRRTGWTS